MRFIHTGDWHLGRQLHGRSLIEDQAWWLDRFVDLVEAERPDAVIIAGDVYDRAVPPAEAVALLDETLTRIVQGLCVPVLMIAGNHDGPERVGFASRVLDEAGLHVAGVLGDEPRSAVIGDARVWLLPYADPIETRAALGDAGVHDHEAAVAACVAHMRACGCTEPLQILVAHHFVAGGVTSDSERQLTVGGTGAVGAHVFEGFDYVALGHLHRRQTLAEGRIHYPGSALKYAFDETANAKAVSIVQIEPGEAPVIETRELGCLRDVRRIIGRYEDVLAAAASDPRQHDYVEVVLQERTMPPEARGRLAEHYPHLLSVMRVLDERAPDADEDQPATHAIEHLTDEELFERFFAYATGAPIADDQRSVLHELLSQKSGDAR